MTCKDDRDIQCFEDCPSCTRYKSQGECSECDTIVEKLELERYQGKCWDCFMDSMIEDEATTRKFVKLHKDLYGEFVKEFYG